MPIQLKLHAEIINTHAMYIWCAQRIQINNTPIEIVRYVMASAHTERARNAMAVLKSICGIGKKN